MITVNESLFIGLCLEGFLYGRIYFQVNLYLAKEVQLFPGLGLYSAIMVIYSSLHGPSKGSRTATIIFYVICLLYVLSTAILACDLLGAIFFIRHPAVSNNSISNLKNIHALSLIRMQCYITFRWSKVQQAVVVTLLPNLSWYTYTIAPIIRFIHLNLQTSKIYRCWIVWGKNIRVVIIPSFLAFSFLGQSIYPLFKFDKPI